VRRFRIGAFWEGISYLLLLFVASRSLLALVLSVVPGGTFWLEGQLRNDHRELERRAA
jgi:hypothetical protein